MPVHASIFRRCINSSFVKGIIFGLNNGQKTTGIKCSRAYVCILLPSCPKTASHWESLQHSPVGPDETASLAACTQLPHQMLSTARGAPLYTAVSPTIC